MKLAVALPDAAGPNSRDEMLEFVKTADDLGFHSVWVAETWRFDAFMVLASLVEHTKQIGLATGVVNVFSRSPALLAQSAATLDAQSCGRAILGLGTSDPGFIEGWHGMPFAMPVQRMRETVEIVRTILRRDKLTFDGQVFKVDTALRIPDDPVRADLPIVVASFGPRNVAQTAEVADGWLPTFWSPAKAKDVFQADLERGLARRDPALPQLDVMPLVITCITDRPDGPRQRVKNYFAFFIGGMGSRERSFYNSLYRRYGYEDEAETIQDLYLERGLADAAAAVTDEMVDDVSMIGPESYVKERLKEFADAGATVLVVDLMGNDHRHRLQMLEQLARAVSA